MRKNCPKTTKRMRISQIFLANSSKMNDRTAVFEGLGGQKEGTSAHA
jgi:hypothetical protein